MKTETGRGEKGKWWKSVLMAAFMAGVLLLLRRMLAGWLLPDGRFLETLVDRVQKDNTPIAQAFFSQVWEWLDA